MINVGDLVMHNPDGITFKGVAKITKQFDVAIVTQIKRSSTKGRLDFVRVIPDFMQDHGDFVEMWFACDELKILNELNND